MAINNAQFSAQPIEQNQDVAIELMVTRPDTAAYLTTPETPNKLVGYYDAFADQVELYVLDNTGRRYLKIV